MFPIIINLIRSIRQPFRETFLSRYDPTQLSDSFLEGYLYKSIIKLELLNKELSDKYPFERGRLI